MVVSPHGNRYKNVMIDGIWYSFPAWLGLQLSEKIDNYRDELWFLISLCGDGSPSNLFYYDIPHKNLYLFPLQYHADLSMLDDGKRAAKFPHCHDIGSIYWD